MKYLKNLGKSLLYIFSITIISTLFFTFLNFINLINSNILSILELIIILISTFVGGFYLGKKAKKKRNFQHKLIHWQRKIHIK